MPLDEINLICFLGVVSATLIGLTFAAPFWLPIAELSQIAYHKNVPSDSCLYTAILQFGRIFVASSVWQYAWTRRRCRCRLVKFVCNLSAGVTLLCAIGLAACKWTRRDYRLIFQFAIILAILFVLRFMNWPPFSCLAPTHYCQAHDETHASDGGLLDVGLGHACSQSTQGLDNSADQMAISVFAGISIIILLSIALYHGQYGVTNFPLIHIRY